MASFGDVSEVEAALQGLQERESGPLVARLPREPGRRESRYMHLFSGEAIPETLAQSVSAEEEPEKPAGETLESRVARLETEMAALRAELEDLKSGGR